MSGIKVPCHHCENRHPCCHSKCEAYATFQAENAKRNAEIKSAQYAEAEIRGYVARAINKHERLKKQKGR